MADGGWRRADGKRRAFLKNSALAGAGLLLLRCGGSAGTADVGWRKADGGPDVPHDAPNGDAGNAIDVPVDRGPDASTTPAPDVWLGLYPAADETEESAVRKVCAELDWSWLGAGDSVFVKVSCNSDKPYPAVTSPAAVTAVCAELFDRGAGKVLVGDQAGIEAVRLAADETLTGSTKACMETNGLYQAIVDSGADPYFFEEHGYEDGYFAATLPFASNWSEGPYIASVVSEVDHIVTLPRLSSHVIAGYTHAHKCGVGWLRDDSRYLLHFDAATMHEKYTELNYAEQLASRHRLTVTAGSRILLDMGPDEGTVADVDPMMVVASANMAHHDALTVALQAYLDEITPPEDGLMFVYDENCNDFNKMLTLSLVEMWYGVPWGEKDKGEYTKLPHNEYWKGIIHDRCLTRAYELQGGAPAAIPVGLLGADPSPELLAFLASYSDAILAPSGVTKSC